jgi:hypothetical protein
MTRFVIAAAASAVALSIAAPAAAEDLHGVWFAGGTVSSDSSGFVGAVRALPGARLGKGLAIRGVVAAGAYEYAGGPGDIEARWEGADIALVSQSSGEWGWSNLSASVGVKHTSLKPADPANESEGTRGDIMVQADGASLSGPVRFNWQASYAFDAEEYGLKLQLSRAFGQDGYRAGVEGGLQGDANYARSTVGVQVGRAFGPNRQYELMVSAGASKFKDSATTGYGSISLSHTF